MCPCSPWPSLATSRSCAESSTGDDDDDDDDSDNPDFQSGVEILSNSAEPEQVFNIKRIVNHPGYQPNRVGDDDDDDYDDDDSQPAKQGRNTRDCDFRGSSL